jgi:putative ABC transport system permease protein
MIVVKLAMRNLSRNRRRTVLSLLLIALGTAALFLLRGYTAEVYTGIKEVYIDMYWNFQIAKEALWEEEFRSYEYIIPKETLSQVERLLVQEPEVVSYTTYLGLTGLVGTEERSTAFFAFGVEPANPAPDLKVKEGRKLESGDLEAALISPDLAKELDIKPGDYLVVMATTVDGVYNAGNLKVVGIFASEAFEGNVAVVPISFVQRLLNTDGVSRITVKLTDDRATEEVVQRLQKALEENGLAELKIKTWEELADFYHRVRSFLGSIFGFVSLVVFLLVFFSVLEGLTMAFFERIREVGTVRAIGTKRHQVFGMFLSEGLLLGLVSGLLGVALGWGLGSLINIAGLTYLPPLAAEPMPFRIALGFDTAWVPFLLALWATTVSAIWPAWRAAKLEIAEALRFV